MVQHCVSENKSNFLYAVKCDEIEDTSDHGLQITPPPVVSAGAAVVIRSVSEHHVPFVRPPALSLTIQVSLTQSALYAPSDYKRLYI